MPRHFRAIFFDLDGTLVDIHGPLYNAARYALEQLGHQPPLTRDRYQRLVAADDMWLGVPEHLRHDYVKLAFAYFNAHNDRTERLEVLPHVRETLGELKRCDYFTAVVTSRPGDPRLLVEKLAMVGLAPLLDRVVTQTARSLRALDKSESLRKAAAEARMPAAECMYVGDEPRDIMASANAGFGAAVAIATGAASYDHLSNHPEYRPDFVLRSMSELLTLLEQLGRDEPP